MYYSGSRSVRHYYVVKFLPRSFHPAPALHNLEVVVWYIISRFHCTCVEEREREREREEEKRQGQKIPDLHRHSWLWWFCCCERPARRMKKTYLLQKSSLKCGGREEEGREKKGGLFQPLTLSLSLSLFHPPPPYLLCVLHAE